MVVYMTIVVLLYYSLVGFFHYFLIIIVELMKVEIVMNLFEKFDLKFDCLIEYFVVWNYSIKHRSFIGVSLFLPNF